MAGKKVQERNNLIQKMHDQHEKELKMKSARFLEKIEDAEKRRSELQAEGPLFQRTAQNKILERIQKDRLVKEAAARAETDERDRLLADGYTEQEVNAMFERRRLALEEE